MSITSFSPPPNSTQGFTLLEVMIAMTIVALIATKLTFAISGQIQTMQRLEEKTMANILAMNQMSLLLSQKQWPALGNRDETVEMARREWIVQTEVKQSMLPKVRQIEVKVGLRPEGLGEKPSTVHKVRSLVSQHFPTEEDEQSP